MLSQSSLFAIEKHKEKNDYVGLYDKVWQIIEKDYVDSSFNAQDWQIWRHRYDEYFKTEDDLYKAIETMVASLGDRYTRFLDKESFKEEKTSIQAELTGVGIQIGLDKEQRVIVIAPIAGTPGANADLRPNDLIIEIDGENTSGLSPSISIIKSLGLRSALDLMI